MFTQNTIDFLIENWMRNDKAWYAAHKEDFRRDVYDPLAALLTALTPTLLEIDAEIVTEPRSCISRIYRDARYIRDGMFYRKEMWLSAKRDKHAFPGWPEFFFSLAPEGYHCGCGWYAQDTATAKAMRRLILRRHPAFIAANAAYRKDGGKLGYTLEGRRRKKSLYPEEPEDVRDWLDRRGIYFISHHPSLEGLYRETLPQEIGAIWRSMAPIYRFFVEAQTEAGRI